MPMAPSILFSPCHYLVTLLDAIPSYAAISTDDLVSASLTGYIGQLLLEGNHSNGYNLPWNICYYSSSVPADALSPESGSTLISSKSANGKSHMSGALPANNQQCLNTAPCIQTVTGTMHKTHFGLFLALLVTMLLR
ncbi:hypothetical protein PHET_02091 [Paragonimus heterotremus]|uniref:Uncharacterized protein n=1 Tax=Paragonimus heterotremus TaxID=100268 RepID=A0A8J4T4G6_9TREM|nr:hypothetical protein PHET_02091 [Paragonimus heterotremus]